MHLERDASGQSLLAIRLIGDSDSERWTPPADADPADTPALAAAWLRTQMGGRGRIGLLSLDLAGAVCSWLDAPSHDAAVVRAAARQAPPGMWGDWSASSGGAAGLDWRAASIGALGGGRDAAKPAGKRSRADASGATTTRSAVLAVSDLPVRLLLDELDRRGVAVERIASLWHAMAAAWDPGAQPDSTKADPTQAGLDAEDSSDDVVLTFRDASDTAVVLIDASGRLAWAWSEGGSLLASGTARLDLSSLRSESSDGHGMPGTPSTPGIAGRLTADWLAWTAQLGRAPARVVCLADETISDGIASFGRSLGAAWPGVSVDVFRVPDPVGATLHRLRETSAGGSPLRPMDAGSTIAGLSSRPGRSHRAMYRWATLGLLAGSAACVTLGVQLRGVAADARGAAALIAAGQRERVAQVLPPGTDLTYPALAASQTLEQLRAERAPAQVKPLPPMIAGAEQIGFVISSSDVRLEQLTMASAYANVIVSGETTESVELLPRGLRGGTDLFRWDSAANISRRGGRLQGEITALWSDSATDGDAGPNPQTGPQTDRNTAEPTAQPTAQLETRR